MAPLLLRRIIPFLYAPFLAGCFSFNTPGDLAVTSVTAVDWYDQPELPGKESSPLRGMVSDDALVELGESLLGREKQHRLILKVEFTTEVDLSEFAIEHRYPIGAWVFRCGHAARDLYIGYPVVFWHGFRIDMFGPDRIRRNELPATYYFFVDVTEAERPHDIPPRPAFDLRTEPEDVCFHLGGGNTVGGLIPTGFHSADVAISRETIAKALHGLTP